MAELAPYRATPEQWAMTEYLGDPQRPPGAMASTASSILELRDRLAAAEQRISELENAITEKDIVILGEPFRQDNPDRLIEMDRVAPVPARSLVEVVRKAIKHEFDYDARAAIMAVADWLEQHNPYAASGRREGWGAAVRCLREEVERG